MIARFRSSQFEFGVPMLPAAVAGESMTAEPVVDNDGKLADEAVIQAVPPGHVLSLFYIDS